MSSTFVGQHISVFNVEMPRLWQVDHNPALQTARFHLRNDVLDATIDRRRVVLVRQRHNQENVENRFERILDALLERGYILKSITPFTEGDYRLQAHLERPSPSRSD